MSICAAVAVLGLAPAAHAAGDAPTGAVSGWHSPAGPETLQLDIKAQAAPGQDLADAAVYLNDTLVSQGALCSPAGACDSGEVTLPFDTTRFADGTYDLRVVATDMAGNAGTVLEYPDFAVWNNRPTGSSTATLSVGSSVPQPSAGGTGSSGGVEGASAGSCTAPKLSMVLDQRPVRMRRGVPVLVAGKRYRFTGRLTCVIGGKRHSAPKRTRIDLRAIVHGRSAPKARGTVGSAGKIVFRIASPSSRTLEFRFTGLNGKVTRVRIKIVTVKAKHKQHKQG